MRKYLTTLLLIGLVLGQEKSISDGPYIFIEKGKLIEKRILNNKVTTRILDQGSYDTLYYPDLSTFNEIRKIAAFSDIHGQYDLLVRLLVNNKIVDKDLNWIFGKGHLVIVGDIFDRGPTQLDVFALDGGRQDATRKLMNRLKFGSEAVLLTPFAAGIGKGAKAIATKGKENIKIYFHLLSPKK